MEKICLGKAVKLHGYMGEIKITTQFDDDFDVSSINEIFDDKENLYKVKRIFKTTDGIVVALNDVGLEQAKSFINRWFYIDRTLVKGKILIEDIKRSEVFFETGEQLGKVIDVQSFGAAEVIFVLTDEGKELMFPNVDGVIKSFDFASLKLVIDKKKLAEISDYDDLLEKNNEN